jgi:hypothetical protein
MCARERARENVRVVRVRDQAVALRMEARDRALLE